MMHNESGNAAYANFQSQQKQLAGMIKRGSDIIETLQLSEASNALRMLSEKTATESLKIMVIGDFSNGKSSLINALLQQSILPAFNLPTTAVINEIKYASEKKAILHFKNPLPKQLPADLSHLTRQHMDQYKGKEIPPMEIPVEDIESYVVIPMGRNFSEMRLESPYAKLELFWPLEMLSHQVEIIDSPGLNDFETRTRVTMEYLGRADIVIFILTADHLCSESEMKFIENTLNLQGYEDIFFVVNKFDIVRASQVQVTKEYAWHNLAPWTGFGKDGVFFVSALDALEGMQNGDQRMYQGSGIPQFSEALSHYLTHKRGKSKLAQPARELSRLIKREAMEKALPYQKALIAQDLGTLQRSYLESKPKLELLESKQRQIHDSIASRIEQMIPFFRRFYREHLIEVCDKIAVWSEEFQSTVKISLFHLKKTTEAYSVEYMKFLNDKMELEETTWSKNALQPAIGQKAKELLNAFDSDIDAFFIEADAIRYMASGAPAKKPIKDVPAWQRVAAVAGGILTLNPGSVIVGGMDGFSKSFGKAVAIEMGGFLLLAALNFWNPLLIIPLAVAAVITGGKGTEKEVVSKIKKTINEQMTEQIANVSNNKIEDTLNDLRTKLYAIQTLVGDSMKTEIDTMRKQMETIIRDKEQGEESAKLKKEKLATCEQQLFELDTALTEFILNMAVQ